MKKITEIARLVVVDGCSDDFVTNFKKAEPLIMRQSGYLGHRLIRHTSDMNQFLLMVDWVSISAHKEGFRQSNDYLEWKALLHHFYDPFPVVEYFSEFLP